MTSLPVNPLLRCALLLAVVLSACGGGGGGKAGGEDGGDRGGGTVTPPASPPLPAAPALSSTEYVVELSRWSVVQASGSETPAELQAKAAANTDHLNAAIRWAVESGFGRIVLPRGTYVVGKRSAENPDYVGGLALESGMALVLDGVVLQLAPSDTWNSCVVEIERKHDVAILGGTIVGDRATHTYRTTSADEGGDDEGHAICIWSESERVLVDRVSLSEATGDGVLVSAQGGAGSSCKDVSITNSKIFENRRQGISIVGGERVLVEGNEIHHILGALHNLGGYGIDVESLDYSSRDLTIRENSFHDNHGGDLVNSDGRSVLFEGNTLDQGEGKSQTDGPIVYWKNADQTIRGNRITVRGGSSNGRVGVIGYSSDAPKTNPATTYIVDNTIVGGGLYMYESGQLQIAGNDLQDGFIALSEMKDVVLRDNAIQQSSPAWAYRFRNCYGAAEGNLLNGQPHAIPLSASTPYTNYADW